MLFDPASRNMKDRLGSIYIHLGCVTGFFLQTWVNEVVVDDGSHLPRYIIY